MSQANDLDGMGRADLIAEIRRLRADVTRADERRRETAELWALSRDNRQRVEHVFRAVLKTATPIQTLGIVQEECGELVAAISQYHRGRVPMSKVAEEIADVQISVGKAGMLIGEDLVDAAFRFKLNRLIDRVGVKF